MIDKLRVAAAEVNWVRPQHMHLTLKFLGDVPDTETPDVCRVVSRAAAQMEPFEITLRRVGALTNADGTFSGTHADGDLLDAIRVLSRPPRPAPR